MHCHNKLVSRSKSFSIWGVYRERDTPVPIPNTEVKPLVGDDTARETVWESSKMPQLKSGMAQVFSLGPFSYSACRSTYE